MWVSEQINFVVGNCRPIAENDFYAKLKKLEVLQGKNDRLFADYVKQVCKVQDRVAFFLLGSTPGPMSSPDTVSNFTVSQWDHRSSMVGYHDHVSTASSQRDYVSQSILSHESILSHYNLANRCGRRPSSHSSPLSETRHVCGKTYHPNSCQTLRVDFFVLFLYPATEVGNYQRGCLLKQDMSATTHMIRKQADWRELGTGAWLEGAEQSFW